jgi:hypothetical protein
MKQNNLHQPKITSSVYLELLLWREIGFVQQHPGKDEINTIIVFLHHSLLVHPLKKLQEPGI